ncbi:Heterodisulfide reductase subunit A-like protein [Methanosarcina sp. MTP4]|nr:Heterodisulfide reductase subunit A-like protein [Methanosarcina sp. MTP4]
MFDCDVEEPDCHLFLGLDLEKIEDVNILVPIVDRTKCDFCGKCSGFCQFNAIAVLPEDILVFPALCHGCGGCALVCPKAAIVYKNRSIGIIEKAKEKAKGENLEFYSGALNIGEALVSAVIKVLKKYADESKTVIFDAPPGTTCPVITSVRGSDYCILVAEPTLFGFHDLLLTIDVIKKLGIPFGIIINRSDIGDDRVEKYCETEGIPVLMKIRHDREIARLYSEGIPFVSRMPEWREKFVQLLDKIRVQLASEEAGNLKEAGT